MEIVVRDDDINFFTDPSSINKLYQPIFQKKGRISLGITPLQMGKGGNKRTDTKNAQEGKIYPILQNKKLCEELRSHQQTNNEMCIHGIYHKKNELALSKSKNFSEAIDLVKTACGSLPKTYIPPFNRVSKQEKSIAFSNKLKVITPLQTIPLSLLSDGKKSKYMLTVYDCLDAASSINWTKRAFLISRFFDIPLQIVNHHWNILSNKKKFTEWHTLLKWILKYDQVQFVTFSELK